MNRYVVLVGLNYQLYRGAGDNNFWREIVPLLARALDRISVVSIKRRRKREEFEFGGCHENSHSIDGCARATKL